MTLQSSSIDLAQSASAVAGPAAEAPSIDFLGAIAVAVVIMLLGFAVDALRDLSRRFLTGNRAAVSAAATLAVVAGVAVVAIAGG